MSFVNNPDGKAADDLLRSYGRFIRNYKEMTDKLMNEKGREIKFLQLKNDPNPENSSMLMLLESENKVLTKILIVFFHLSKEARKLNKHSKIIAKKLFVIEDEIISVNEVAEMNAQDAKDNALIKFSYALEDLVDMKFFIQNAIFLSVNVFQQYCALFSMEKYLQITPTTIFPSNMDDVMLLFKNLMIFDLIFKSGVYKTYLNFYNDLLMQQQSDDDERFTNLQNTLHELDLLLDGNILHIALDNVIAIKGRVKAKNLKLFESFMLTYIKNIIYGFNILGNYLSELSDVDELIKLNIAVVIYQRLFENLDPKHMRIVLDINYKYPSIIIHGNMIWNGNEFLKKYLTCMEKTNVDIEKLQMNYMNQRINEISKDALNYSNQVYLWILQIHQQSRFGNENLNEPMLQMRCELYYQGLTLAGEMTFLIKTMVNLHAKFGQLLSKSVVSYIFKLIENLQLIKSTFNEKSKFISDSMPFVFQYLQFHTLNVIGMCKKKVMLDAKKEHKFDLSTTLVLIEKLLYGTVSVNNLSAITLALNLTEPFKNFGNEYTIRLIKLLDHMTMLCRLDENLERVCDTSFLFWHQNLISSNFKQHMESALDEFKISFMLESIEECMKNCDYQQLDNVRNFYPFIERNFSENVTRKLCNSIEINLRLDFHSNIQVDKFNPFDVNCKILMEDHRRLIKLNPIIVNDEYISIQDDVEYYLSKMFYNLTTISLKDWRTYEEMRRLAQRKYLLDTVDDHLPTQTLDQGIDVLQIMRNIHLFVSRFNYNLNNQIFVEAIANNNQHFNTIGINNIANSLSTHGFGIINTTINFVYQFMRRKLSIFSQVIYDERIKSRLTREMKILRDNIAIDKNSEVYGFERALSLHDYVKNLESFEGNQTLMDKIRSLISSIGNSLGYIRMIKSGINNVNSNSISFIPNSSIDDDGEETALLNMCQSNNLSDSTVTAAEYLQKDIGQSMKKIAEGSLYFKMLISTFSPYFRNTKNSHMKNFYIFVPALTINYVKYILKSKDRLKRTQDELVFTDDGFSIGLVYILRLLNQLSEYNSLNWTKTIRHKIKSDKDKILKQREELAKTNKSNDEKLLQTLLLSEMRINAFQTEFELLFYNINSVKIFFQS